MKLHFKLSSDLELIPQGQVTLDYMSKRKEGEEVVLAISDKTVNRRTLTQNGCLHEYLTNLATALNDAGYDVKATITAPVQFTLDNAKEYMFKPVMSAMYPDIKSTTKLSTVQMSEVYENLNRLTAEKFGISVLWPSRFNN